MNKVCIIEDNNILVKNLTKKLIANGIEVVYENADLYLVDLSLEWKMSWDIIEKIRSESDAIILIYSWYNTIRYREKALTLWVDGYIDKITSPDCLMFDIKYILNTYNRLWKKL